MTGGIVIRTQDGLKKHVFPYVYAPYLILMTVLSRTSTVVSYTQQGGSIHSFITSYHKDESFGRA